MRGGQGRTRPAALPFPQLQNCCENGKTLKQQWCSRICCPPPPYQPGSAFMGRSLEYKLQTPWPKLGPTELQNNRTSSCRCSPSTSASAQDGSGRRQKEQSPRPRLTGCRLHSLLRLYCYEQYPCWHYTATLKACNLSWSSYFYQISVSRQKGIYRQRQRERKSERHTDRERGKGERS